MITLIGSCDKCSKLIESKAFDPNSEKINIMICNTCYNRYYSLEAQRDNKLNKVLRRGLKERIKEWLK